MIQEAIGLSERIEKKTPKFKVGAQILADVAKSLGRQGLLPKKLPVEVHALPPKVPKEMPEIKGSLERAVAEFNTRPHTPELINETFETIWYVRGRLVGLTFEVTPCPYTKEELADLKAEGRRVGFLPPKLATQQVRHRLGEIFPKMQSHSIHKDNLVTNDEDPSGWFDYEAEIDAPYTNTTEEQLRDKLEEDERRLLSLNQYIIAGQDSKLFTEKYLDETGTSVRLGSRKQDRDKDRVVKAYFSKDGDLHVVWNLGERVSNPCIGGRSFRVRRA